MPVIPMQQEPYAQAEAGFQTGDILLFEGKSPLDYMIQEVEGSLYNHVGMIIRQGDTLYFWDAPGGGNQFPDPYRSNQPHTGCRVAPLEALLEYYMSEEVALFYRQLQTPLSADQIAALNIFINQADGLPFPFQTPSLPDEANLGLGLMGSFLLGNLFKATIAGSYFCAQLVADTYMHMGLLPISPFPANSYSPATFASYDPDKLPLVNCSLGSVIQLIDYPQVARTPVVTPVSVTAVAAG